MRLALPISLALGLVLGAVGVWADGQPEGQELVFQQKVFQEVQEAQEKLGEQTQRLRKVTQELSVVQRALRHKRLVELLRPYALKKGWDRHPPPLADQKYRPWYEEWRALEREFAIPLTGTATKTSTSPDGL